MSTVSIVVSIFNSEKFIDKSIHAILGQTFADFELILVDDGSQDQSLKKCIEYAEKDIRIKVLHKENGGAGSGRNFGMEAACGKYIIFPDADDWMDSNMLELMVNSAEEYEVDFVVCGYYNHLFDCNEFTITTNKCERTLLTTSTQVKEHFFFDIPHGWLSYFVWNKLYKLDTIKNNALVFSDLKRGQDIVFNADFYNIATNCLMLDSVLYHYRTNTTASLSLKFPRDAFFIYSQVIAKLYDCLHKWDLNSKVNSEIVAYAYLAFISECLTTLYKNKFEMSLTDKRKLVFQIANDPLVQTALDSIHGKKMYQKLIRNLLLRKKYFMVIGFTVLIQFIREYVGFLFKILKRINNHGRV